MTVYLPTVPRPAPTSLRLYAVTTRTLLAWADEHGVYLFDRRTKCHHLLSWEEIQRVQQSATSSGSVPVEQPGT